MARQRWRWRKAQQALLPPIAPHAASPKPWVAFLCDNKAVSALLVALLVFTLGALLVPSDSSHIAHAVTTRRLIFMPPVRDYVQREETGAIIRAVTEGAHFVIVEGGNRMGKTIAVRAAAVALSHTRAVLWYNCTEDSTMDAVLRGLYDLDNPPLIEHLVGALQGAARLARPSVSSLVLRMGALMPEPVLVVEMAELLGLEELRRLLSFAKQLVDARLGRFILVFSPSDSLGLISGAGALSRAKVIPVLDLTRAQAEQYLSSRCSEPRAASVYSLLGGHLPHLMEEAVARFCAADAPDQGALAAHFSTLVAAKLKAVEMGMACHAGACACAVACAIANEQWGHALLSSARRLLLSQHLIRASLQQHIFVMDAPFVRSYVEQRCGCSRQLAAAVPPGITASPLQEARQPLRC